MNRYTYKAKSAISNASHYKGEWVYGYLMVKRVSSFNNTYDDYLVIQDEFFEEIKIDPSTICQCTGVQDKNDKYIYEWDIVKARRCGTGYIERPIYFKDGKFAFDGSNYSFKDLHSGLEVTGNKFDNEVIR